jgi:hypothetical protein
MPQPHMAAMHHLQPTGFMSVGATIRHVAVLEQLEL